MAISLTAEQVSTLKSYLSPNSRNYPAAYRLLAQATENASDFDSSRANTWFRGAAMINEGIGPLATLTYSYTRQQGTLRGITLGNSTIQQASDAIADLIIGKAIERESVPTFDEIRRFDADGAKTLYDGFPGDSASSRATAWSGIFLISSFGADETGRLLAGGTAGELDRVSDLRDVLFADYVFPKAVTEAAMAAAASLSSMATWSAAWTAFRLPEPGRPFTAGKYYAANYTAGNAASSALRQVADFTPEEILNKLAKLAGVQGGGFETTAPLVFKALDGANRVEWLDASALSRAQTDIAYRYALKELNPFAVLGADYSRFNANGALDLHDPKTGKGELTEAWLRDRAAMLAAVIDYRRRDANDNTIDSTFAFKDAASGINLGPNQLPQVGVIFGSEQGDSLAFTHTRGDKVHLYGGAGNDVLIGGYSDDYLEGGADNDQLRGGAGKDELWGGRGDDQLQGEAGQDTLIGSRGKASQMLREAA